MMAVPSIFSALYTLGTLFRREFDVDNCADDLNDLTLIHGWNPRGILNVLSVQAGYGKGSWENGIQIRLRRHRRRFLKFLG